MKQLQYRVLPPGAAASPVKMPKLSPRASDAISMVTKKSRPTGQDFLAWARALPAGTTMRQELKKLMNVGDGTIKELIELAVSDGMERTEIDLAYELGKCAYTALRRITGKPSPLKQDFGDWIAGFPAGTHIRRKLRSHADRAATERLMKFAIREGLIKSREQESAKTTAGPDYCI